MTETVKEYPLEVVHGTALMHDVPIKDMFVHYRTEPGGYARPLRPWRVNYLVATWDPQALGVLLLSLRPDGRLAIIDGHHRQEAAVKKGYTMLDAQIYVDLSLEDEARLYRKFGDYLKQTALDRYHAGIQEGVPEYLAIQRILQDLELHVPMAPGGAVGAVNAVEALFSATKLYGPDLVTRTLRLIKQAWGTDPRAYRAQILTGTSMFLVRYKDHPKFNQPRLVKRMTDSGYSGLERRVTALRDANVASNPNVAWGMGLLALHDFHVVEENHLPDWVRRHYSEDERLKRREHIKNVSKNQTPAQRSANARKAMVTRFGGTPRQIPCPKCKAIAGDPCVSAKGWYYPQMHDARRQAYKALPNSKAPLPPKDQQQDAF